jgi:hypothetical protein
VQLTDPMSAVIIWLGMVRAVAIYEIVKLNNTFLSCVVAKQASATKSSLSGWW